MYRTDVCFSECVCGSLPNDHVNPILILYAGDDTSASTTCHQLNPEMRVSKCVHVYVCSLAQRTHYLQGMSKCNAPREDALHTAKPAKVASFWFVGRLFFIPSGMFQCRATIIQLQLWETHRCTSSMQPLSTNKTGQWAERWLTPSPR